MNEDGIVFQEEGVLVRSTVVVKNDGAGHSERIVLDRFDAKTNEVLTPVAEEESVALVHDVGRLAHEGMEVETIHVPQSAAAVMDVHLMSIAQLFVHNTDLGFE